MKANAPEEIYPQEPTKVRTEKKYDNDVEYCRTDAFIEKACDYLSYHLDTSKIGVNYKFDFLEFKNRPRVKVERIDSDGNKVCYGSMAEAARKNNVSIAFIQRRVSGKSGIKGHDAKLTDYKFRIKEN